MFLSDLLKKREKSMLQCDDFVVTQLYLWLGYVAYENLAYEKSSELEYCCWEDVFENYEEDLPSRYFLNKNREIIKEAFREILLSIGVPKNSNIQIEKIYANISNLFHLLVGEKSYNLQLQGDYVTCCHSLHMVDEEGNTIHYERVKDDRCLTFVETYPHFDSTLRLKQKCTSSSYECEVSNDTERILVTVSYLADFKRPLIIEVEKTIANIIKQFNKEESSIDILYTSIKSVLFGTPVENFSVQFSKKVNKDEQEVWLDTDCAINKNGVMTLFRITKNGRTLEVDHFDAWIKKTNIFSVQKDSSSNISFHLTNQASEEELSDIMSRFDCLSEYRLAKEEAEEVIRLKNRL